MGRLAGDKDIDVRRLVAENPNTPVAILGRLKNTAVRDGVAANPNTPIALLERLAGDKNIYIRLLVAENPNTPMQRRIAILVRLAGDKDEDVRRRVAKNPNTPISILERLANDKDSEVRLEVASNPSCSTRIILAQSVAGTKPSWHRLIALAHPECPVEALAKYYRSSSWLERCAIAQNPSTPPATLKKLTEDPHVAVSAAAAENLQVRTQGAQ